MQLDAGEGINEPVLQFLQLFLRCLRLLYREQCNENSFKNALKTGRNSGSPVVRGLPETWSDYQISQLGSPADYQNFGVISTPA